MDPFAQQLVKRAQQVVQSNIQRLGYVTSLREVMQLLRPAYPPQVRGLLRGSSEEKRLRLVASQVAKKLVDKQLAELSQLGGTAFEQRLQQLQQQEWVHLRGNFPGLLHQSDRAVIALRNRAERTTALAPSRKSSPSPK